MKRVYFLVFFALIFIFNLKAQIPTNGLAAYWPFDGNANDISGNNANGTLYGATLASDRFGNSNQSYLFDGVDDYMNTNLNSGISNQLTIALWLKSESTNDWSGIITSRGYANSFSGFSLLPGGNICFYINTYTYVFTSDFNILDNNWNFIAGTYDGSNLKLYINDSLIGITASSAGVSVPDFFKIGNDDISNNRFWKGYIDDVCIYNRALDDDELLAMYLKDACFGYTTSDTVSYFVSSVEFEDISPRIYLESVDSLMKHDGCDSLIFHYYKYIYNPTHCIDTIPIFDSVSVTDTLIIDVTITPTDISTVTNTIKLYPNPVKDKLYIYTGSYYNHISDYTIKITDATGLPVFESIINQLLFEINMNEFGKTGLYFVQIIDNDYNIVETRKILLQ